MLQIRLSKPSSETGATVKPLSTENVTVACPDHLVLADLPVAKGIGVATAATTVKSVGRRSRRLLGERVHFCVRCDLPIAIYGRLNPCEHAFCLDCARSDSICYLCDERIQKIQTIKMMEGIFICAAPHCLKSFLKRAEFEFHIHGTHADLLQPKAEKDSGNESDSATRAAAVLPRPPPPLPLSSNSQFLLDFEEEKARMLQNQNPPLLHLPMIHAHLNGVHYNAMPEQTAISKNPPMNPVPMPNMVLQMNTNPVLVPPFVPGLQPDGAPMVGNGHGSLLGLSAMAESYHETWNAAPVHASSIPFYPAEYGGFAMRFPHPPPFTSSSSMDIIHGSSATDSRDGKGILTAAHQPFHLPPPPPAPFSLPLLRRDLHSGDPS